MIDRERLLKEFITLTAFDSESYYEGGIRDYLKDRLIGLGLSVYEDDAGSRLGHENPRSAGNLYGHLPGELDGSLLFCAHMDTVSPGIGKKAVVGADGRITSDGTTVLGADDVSGIVSILEALTSIGEEKLPHPDIEVLFTVAEEPYCKGASLFDYDRISSKLAYVLDLTGRVGTAAIQAPSILSLKIDVEGKAAHAGFAPEDGVNALAASANALAKLRTGHTSPDTTVNFGTISGGTGKNIVPAAIHIEGEIRSLRHEQALAEAERIRTIFSEEAGRMCAKADIEVIEEIHAYAIGMDEAVVNRLGRALAELNLGESELVTTFGGSDANCLNKNGIRSIVIANAMEQVHTVREYTSISELEKSAKLTQALMTLTED